MNDENTYYAKPLDRAVNDLASYLSVDSFSVRKPKHQVMYSRATVTPEEVEYAEEISTEGGYDRLRFLYEMKNLSTPGVHQKFRKAPIKKPTGQPPVVVVVSTHENWAEHKNEIGLPELVYHHVQAVSATLAVNLPPYTVSGEEYELVKKWHTKERFLLLALLKNEIDFATNFCARTFKRGDSIIAVAPQGIHPVTLKLIGWLLIEVRHCQTHGFKEQQFYELFDCTFTDLAVFLQVIAPSFLMEREVALRFGQCYIERCQDPIRVEKFALGLKELIRLVIKKSTHNSMDSAVVDELKNIQLRCMSIANLADAYQEFCISSGDMN